MPLFLAVSKPATERKVIATAPAGGEMVGATRAVAIQVTMGG
jgi:hypothetical protein